jgi:hypothetical protein
MKMFTTESELQLTTSKMFIVNKSKSVTRGRGKYPFPAIENFRAAFSDCVENV